MKPVDISHTHKYIRCVRACVLVNETIQVNDSIPYCQAVLDMQTKGLNLANSLSKYTTSQTITIVFVQWDYHNRSLKSDWLFWTIGGILISEVLAPVIEKWKSNANPTIGYLSCVLFWNAGHATSVLKFSVARSATLYLRVWYSGILYYPRKQWTSVQTMDD